MIANKTPRSSELSGVPGPVVSAISNWALWVGLFVVALTLLGGSSRPDPIQHAVLRPIAALLLIPALFRLRAADLASARAIIGLGGLMLVWMIVQIVPVPAAFWQALPGRDVIAQLDQLAGVEGIWRPLTLTPFRGQNAVLGTVVPIAALFLALSARLKAQSIFLVLTFMGLINGAFGILQVVGGPNSPFYLFAMTSRGAPAGIFANENHSAVFASIVLLVVARLAIDGRSRNLSTWIKLSLAPAYAFILLAILLSGSRAGLATAVLALGAGGLMIWSAYRPRGRVVAVLDRSNGSERLLGLALPAAGGAAVILIIAAFLLLGRVPAAQDLMASGGFEDLRWSLWPTLTKMMSEHWLFGTGFGSFDVVYRLYEPTALLFPLYVNHAHNDWAQLVIEGGLPAIVVSLGLIVWLFAAILRIAREKRGSGAIVIFWIALVAILMAASVVDYPLRTPIFQAASVWLMLCLAREGEEWNKEDGETDRS
jgi:O-antigen ligase